MKQQIRKKKLQDLTISLPNLNKVRVHSLSKKEINGLGQFLKRRVPIQYITFFY